MHRERDRGLHVRDRARVDADDGHPPLCTGPAQAGVQETRVHGPVAAHERLPVGHLERAGLGRAPRAVGPLRLDLGAVPCGVRGGVAGPGGGTGPHERVGEVGLEGGKGVCGGPAGLVVRAEALLGCIPIGACEGRECECGEGDQPCHASGRTAAIEGGGTLYRRCHPPGAPPPGP